MATALGDESTPTPRELAAWSLILLAGQERGDQEAAEGKEEVHPRGSRIEGCLRPAVALPLNERLREMPVKDPGEREKAESIKLGKVKGSRRL